MVSKEKGREKATDQTAKTDMDGRKLFIRMAIFKRDHSINCSHVVRGSAQITLKRCGGKRRFKEAIFSLNWLSD